ncbi:hypothetical protein DdX_18856 [Ditylenchus destructor]|uniref:Uncharacterized protein n=1 Tax=Ditylenchus destructor TaxID=166010 RepID=A0AAD4QXQ0_9BILA|nr:hypothetical protein DdX_18856 [Ditylenchus destructor]
MPQEGWAGPMSAGLSIDLTQKVGHADSRVVANTQPAVNWPDPMNAALAEEFWTTRERWIGLRQRLALTKFHDRFGFNSLLEVP